MNTSTQLSRALTGALLASLMMVSILTAGGDKYSPKTVGMGRAFTATSRGLDAVGMNPANLALDDRNATVTVNLPHFGLAIGSDLINYEVYTKFFTGEPQLDPVTGQVMHDNNGKEIRVGKDLSDQDKKDILALFPSGIARTQFGLETSPIGLSLQIGDFGFAVVPSVQVVTNLDMPEGYLKFLLNGLAAEGSNYDLSGTALNSSAVGEVNVSAAYKIPFNTPDIDEIAIGVGVKYLVGIGYVITDKYNSRITSSPLRTSPDGNGNLTDLNAHIDFLQFTAIPDEKNPMPGTGLGFDVGATALFFDNVRFGVSVTDIGSITWDKNTQAIIGDANLSIYSIADKSVQDSLSNAFKGKTIDTTGFTFDLPTQVHVGFAVQMDDVLEDLPFRWLVAADMHLGLNEVAGNTKIPQFALGTELDPLAGWLPLRTGIMIGGREHFAWSLGFGIHLANTFDLDFATQSIAIITNPNSFRTGSFTMGMRLRL